jgi:NAD(P)H-dependent FMN reductase
LNAGGARAVEQLRQVAVEVRMVSVRHEVNIRLIGVQLEDGPPTDPFYAARAQAMVNELSWWGRVTKEGRARHALPT